MQGVSFEKISSVVKKSFIQHNEHVHVCMSTTFNRIISCAFVTQHVLMLKMKCFKMILYTRGYQKVRRLSL